VRALNEPQPLEVRTDPEGRPLAVRRPSWRSPRPVARVQDHWRIDDEWWRERSVSRLYHALLLADDTFLTAYHDLLADAWFEQRD
jgi:hypothetical protein